MPVDDGRLFGRAGRESIAGTQHAGTLTRSIRGPGRSHSDPVALLWEACIHTRIEPGAQSAKMDRAAVPTNRASDRNSCLENRLACRAVSVPACCV
ncbi:hypothetical protein B5T_03254 [Alloalcanivorax dieselolei B5]|uniref:Uncharacterized protein n=1 Tax=Alcanivorax dieselolei (strain DSM 16502 / CGMCC 1.3690 / MCCC 1A00001 / B-5) TaxID=930169 RepID=K0CIX1_ALCDB|nr:hypothetical protein B5T_03254 [Alloalcanivorax dieselolei B5]